MDAPAKASENPPTKLKENDNNPFEENDKDPLVELNVSGSTELWLIQWPIHQAPDFDGKEVKLKLHKDGHLGSLEGSPGKSYDLVSFSSQHPDATVFQSSKTGSKIVGNISRRVSLIHYPEPNELQKSTNLKKPKSSGISYTKSGRTTMTPASSTKVQKKPSATRSEASAPSSKRNRSEVSTPSSKHKSSLSEERDIPNTTRRKYVNEPTSSVGVSGRSSQGHSGVSAASEQHSLEAKSIKKMRK